MKEKLPWKISIFASIIVSGILTGISLFFPVLRVLNHEFTQIFTLTSSVTLFFISAWIVKTAIGLNQQSNRLFMVQRSFSLALVSALFMAGTSILIMIVYNQLGPQCRLHEGIPFFFVTWIPTAIGACVLGCSLGAWRIRWLFLLLVSLFILLISIALDLLQLVLGWRVTDLLIGVPYALDQRAVMSVPEYHIYQRSIIVLFSAIIWFFNLWMISRNYHISLNTQIKIVARERFIIFITIVTIMVVSAGSYIGMGWGYEALNLHLDQNRKSENFIFRYKRGGQAENYMDAIIRSAEWYNNQLSQRLQLQSTNPVRVYVFDSWTDVKEHTGMGNHAGLRSIYIDCYAALSSTFMHELVHARHIELNPRVSVILNRGMIEGLATAIEHDYAFTPGAHQMVAAAYKEGKLPSARKLMSVTGF